MSGTMPGRPGGRTSKQRILRAIAAAVVPVVVVGLLIPARAQQSRLRSHRLDPDGAVGGWRGSQPGRRQAAARLASPITENFDIVGHHDLGANATYGDVWIHGNYAYVGTWRSPCNGSGVAIVDVSNPEQPVLVGRIAQRTGTSAEDVVVRAISTPAFTGDLAAVGIQRCGRDEDLDSARFGVEFWDVTDPANATRLAVRQVTSVFGGVHELDLIQRGVNVYAALAAPYSEWFDRSRAGDVRIIDATNPGSPVPVAQWSARAAGLSKGPFHGLGSFGSNYAHSVRFSEDGTRIYVSYWDLGVITLDITDIDNPVPVGRTRYPRGAEGNGHSVSEYGDFLLQNDEDEDPRSPARIRVAGREALASEHPFAPALWRKPDHRVRTRVVKAARQGCAGNDYPGRTRGKIVVVRTLFTFYDEVVKPPACSMGRQERHAARAGAVAVVHDWISTRTSPQWVSEARGGIPVLFARHGIARKMVDAGVATLRASKPSVGYLRVFDRDGGRQVARFDRASNAHRLRPPVGSWSIHNNEVLGNRSYASWYTNGILAIDLTPLDSVPPENPTRVGRFVPGGAPSRTKLLPDNVPNVWGVAVRDSDGLLFVSDMNGGLWIVRATGPAAPTS